MEKTTVIRIRLPRDKSFIYLRINKWRIHGELIRRKYWSKRRVEIMRFSFPKGDEVSWQP